MWLLKIKFQTNEILSVANVPNIPIIKHSSTKYETSFPRTFCLSSKALYISEGGVYFAQNKTFSFFLPRYRLFLKYRYRAPHIHRYHDTLTFLGGVAIYDPVSLELMRQVNGSRTISRGNSKSVSAIRYLANSRSLDNSLTAHCN